MVITARRVFASYVGLIVLLSLLPRAPELPVPGGDKLTHFAAYVLMALLGMPLAATVRAQLLMLLTIVAIGGALEGLQAIVPNRAPSELDLVANVTGAVVGASLWVGAVRVRQRRVTR